MINLSLSTGYVSEAFKAAVMEPLFKKPLLGAAVLANYKLGGHLQTEVTQSIRIKQT